MAEIINFLKEILMIKDEKKIYVGLSQFKPVKESIIAEPLKPKKTEVKISDLMRRSM